MSQYQGNYGFQRVSEDLKIIHGVGQINTEVGSFPMLLVGDRAGCADPDVCGSNPDHIQVFVDSDDMDKLETMIKRIKGGHSS